MRGTLFAGASVLSLLLCVAAAGSWVWSYRAAAGCVGWADPTWGEADLAFREGEIDVVWGKPALWFINDVPEASATVWDGIGFRRVYARSGFVRNPGVWWVLWRQPNTDWHTRRHAQRKDLVIVHDPSEVPNAPASEFGSMPLRRQCLEDVRWRWRGIEYRDVIAAYDFRYGIVFAHEFALPRRVAPLFAIGAFGLLPAIWLPRVARRVRSRILGGGTNRCPSCSYSLMGNTSGVCPECGTAVEAGAYTRLPHR